MGSSSGGASTNRMDLEIARSRDAAEVEKMKLQLDIEKTKTASADAQYKMYCDQQIKVAEISSAAITASAQATSQLYGPPPKQWWKEEAPSKGGVEF